jgi:hypothetical protein
MFDAKVKYVFNDNALRAITSGVAQLNASRVRVGVLGSAGLATHPNSSLRVWQIAAIQEFGTKSTPHIPERSFIRKTLNDLVWLRLVMSRAAGRVIKGHSADSALNWLGQIIVAAVKRTLMQSVPPPNKPDTVDWKGHGHTLIGLTSTLFNAIGHDIVRGKGSAKVIAVNPVE